MRKDLDDVVDCDVLKQYVEEAVTDVGQAVTGALPLNLHITVAQDICKWSRYLADNLVDKGLKEVVKTVLLLRALDEVRHNVFVVIVERVWRESADDLGYPDT